nr:PDDEXK nuclease domain-containing protein [Victivallales bacterium]
MPKKKRKQTRVGIDKPTFGRLVDSIRQVHCQLAAQASRAVNISLTLRNWLIGCYIAEYEMNGSDRAKYGENLLRTLSDNLTNVSNCNRRQLYRYLRFYRLYPRIVGTASAQFQKLIPEAVAQNNEKVGTASPQLSLSSEQLMGRLSYSHIDLLVDMDDDTKRTFYEVECVRGNWSVRELKRQIASLYYERSGLSKDKKRLAELVKSGAEKEDIALNVRDPYVFEFLGIKPREVMGESELEDELLDKLQDFLLELGNGFCFEARQKRILIGDSYNFIDLVFYHRILKCHVL